MLTIDNVSGMRLQYLAEGAANIVYMIIPESQSPSIAADADFEDYEHLPSEIATSPMDPALEGKLIRLRKATPSGVTVRETYRHYEKAIVPLFPQHEDLVEQILIKPTRALLEDLNIELKTMEACAERPRKRNGTYLAEDEDHGLLITDMSNSSPLNAAYRCLEFKPKWLVQSPSAPIDAVRCRICALRHLRRSQHHQDSTEWSDYGFCPLGLVSKEKAVVGKTVERIFRLTSDLEPTEADDKRVRQHLTDYIYLNPLLGRLSEIQRGWDPLGVVKSEDSVAMQKLSVAMTLRDCTCFLKIPIGDNGEVEARLGDLDLKSPENGKREYWSSIESELIDSGWYTATEKVEVDVDKFCILSEHP